MIDAPSTDMIEELERLAKAATPGPWERGNLDSMIETVAKGNDYEHIANVHPKNGMWGEDVNANRKFIAAANPQTILTLSRRNRGLEQALKEAERKNAFLGKWLDLFSRAARPFANLRADDGDTFDKYPNSMIIRTECSVGEIKAIRKAVNGPPQDGAELVMFPRALSKTTDTPHGGQA